MAAGAAGAAAANSLADNLERHFSMLKLRLFACYAISLTLLLGACGMLVHRLVSPAASDTPAVHIHDAR